MKTAANAATPHQNEAALPTRPPRPPLPNKWKPKHPDKELLEDPISRMKCFIRCWMESKGYLEGRAINKEKFCADVREIPYPESCPIAVDICEGVASTDPCDYAYQYLKCDNNVRTRYTLVEVNDSSSMDGSSSSDLPVPI